ncbi:MAG: hypothetical protein RLY93_09995 [Sumerlaeia bacterium]
MSTETPTAAQDQPFQTYYEDQDDCCVTNFTSRLRDRVLKRMPVGVTEHLVASRKELLKAGIAFAESRMRDADEVLERAKALHRKG